MQYDGTEHTVSIVFEWEKLTGWSALTENPIDEDGDPEYEKDEIVSVTESEWADYQQALATVREWNQRFAQRQ